jgi:hypothetical protein
MLFVPRVEEVYYLKHALIESHNKCPLPSVDISFVPKIWWIRFTHAAFLLILIDFKLIYFLGEFILLNANEQSNLGVLLAILLRSAVRYILTLNGTNAFRFGVILLKFDLGFIDFDVFHIGYYLFCNLNLFIFLL